jgi:hypothetical protein
LFPSTTVVPNISVARIDSNDDGKIDRLTITSSFPLPSSPSGASFRAADMVSARLAYLTSYLFFQFSSGVWNIVRHLLPHTLCSQISHRTSSLLSDPRMRSHHFCEPCSQPDQCHSLRPTQCRQHLLPCAFIHRSSFLVLCPIYINRRCVVL